MIPRPLTRTAAYVPVALVLLAFLSAPARAEGVDLDDARQRLERLDRLLSSSRSVNEELLDALDQVEASYLALRSSAAAEADEDAAAECEKWLRGAEKLALRAFVLVRTDRRDRTRNLRDPVNVRAAQLLGRTGRPALWKDVRRLLETRHFKAKHEVPRVVLESGFDALAALGDPKALAWMTDEFVHTNSSPQKVVDRLVAAQQAFVKFPLENVSGAQRHAIVKKLVTLYPATESVASQNSSSAAVQSTRRFWDQIRTGVILMAQHFAGTPRNADGEALATMQDLAAWFREHKSVRKAPWTDPAPPRG